MQPKVSWFKRVQFSGAARIEIYEMLGLLLENRVLLIDALREIRGVMNDNGKREQSVSSDPGRIDDIKIRNVKAEAVHGWIVRLKSGDERGFALSKAIAPWVPQDEASLIQAGEATGDISGALKDAIEGIQGKGVMVGAVVSGTLYPLVLLGAAYFVMRIIATRVVPPFARQVDPELWEGAAKLLYIEANLFNSYAPTAALASAIFLIVAIGTLPYLRGGLRVFLDRRLPPWNIYKMVHGSTFLRNVAVQTRSGIKLYDAVGAMIVTASPWLKERLQAAQYGIQQGQNLGEALYNAEYDFPDRRSVQILRVLASRDGFDETIYRFAKRWQLQTIQQVKSASTVMLSVGILAIGLVAGSTFMGIQGLSSMIEENADADASGAAGR